MINLIVVAAMLFVSSGALAGDSWEANLMVTAGEASCRLSMGQRVDATEFNDGHYDVPAMLSGELHAYFIGGGGVLWRDIRPLDSPGQEWSLMIKSSKTNAPVEISWETEKLPAGFSFDLFDKKTGKELDMREYSSYMIENAAGINLLVRVHHE
jgi:hypothetical protein